MISHSGGCSNGLCPPKVFNVTDLVFVFDNVGISKLVCICISPQRNVACFNVAPLNLFNFVLLTGRTVQNPKTNKNW